MILLATTDMSKTVEKDHVNNVCKIGQGYECCRYLTFSGKYGFQCEKESSLKEILDDRAKSETMIARGDNCVGWDKLQGLN